MNGPPSHDHAHHHHPAAAGRLLWLAAGLTLAYAAVEASVGWWAGSLALIKFNSLADGEASPNQIFEKQSLHPLEFPEVVSD